MPYQPYSVAVNDDAPVRLHQLNPSLWITANELADLVGIASQNARGALLKAKQGKSWRGVVLAVREVASHKGQGGKYYQVHVDSLPADVRGLFWAKHGADAFMPPPVPMAERALIPEKIAGDKDFAGKLPLARWKLAMIEPIIGLQGQAKAAAIADLVGKEMVMPDGSRLVLKRATLYHWLKKFEEGGLTALTKAARSNKGASFVKVSQAWDEFMAGKIGASVHEEVQGVIYRYIRSLWVAGEHGWVMISEKSTRAFSAKVVTGFAVRKCDKTND